jgi:hypothetical protein
LLKEKAMQVSIRVEGARLGARSRRNAEVFVQRVFQREWRRLDDVTICLGTIRNRRGADEGYLCRLSVGAQALGVIAVEGRGDTVRTALQQASLRARLVLRRRWHARRNRARRRYLNQRNVPQGFEFSEA